MLCRSRLVCLRTKSLGRIVHVMLCPRDASSQGRLVQGPLRSRVASSKERIIQATHHPRDGSSKGRIVQGPHRQRVASSMGRIVQWSHRPRDASSKGTHRQCDRTSETFCLRKYRSGTLFHVIIWGSTFFQTACNTTLALLGLFKTSISLTNSRHIFPVSDTPSAGGEKGPGKTDFINETFYILLHMLHSGCHLQLT